MKQLNQNLSCAFRKWKSRIIKAVLLISLPGAVIAQVGTVSAVPQVVSPDAAALGKFVEVPVSNYSGLPEIGIPIYSLNAKGMNVPVSLSYHASGVKVKEFPGWVGANWALNAGGAITRVVRGEPDGNDMSHPGFYKQYAAVMGTPGYNYPDPRLMTGVVSEHFGTQKEDTEFDLFYYNFMGHTGRMTFDNTGKPMFLETNGMKVTYGGGFEITDADGTVYTFLDTESYQWPGNYPYATTWYLSSISRPQTDEVINFSYKKYPYNDFLYRYNRGPDSFYDKNLFQDIFPPQGAIHNPACETYNRVVSSSDLSQGETCVLQRISYKGDSIKFYHDTSRADNYKVRLDSIKVFQGAVNVHTSRFAYTFSNSGSSDPKEKKMLLASVQSNDQPAYTFSYYGSFNSKGLPGPYANSSDLWGFFNGGSYDIYTPVGTPRNPDYRYGQIGSLQTISYPTGGNTEFTYEGNDFSYAQNVLDSIGPIYHAGGLRIKKIRFNSPVSSSSFEKMYEYTHGAKSSGVLEVPFANIGTMFYWGEGRDIPVNPYCRDQKWPQVCSFYTVHHDNLIPLGNAQGGVIGYAQVIEKSSDGSKKVMQFTNGGFDAVTYYPLLDPLLDGYGDGYNNDYLGDKVIQDRLTNDYSTFRGRLKNVAYYNSSGQKLRQEMHQFTNLADRLTFSNQLKTTNFYLVPGEVNGQNVCGDPPDYATGWSGYFNIQRNVVPSVDSLYTFKGADTLKEVVKYDYSTPFQSQASKIVKISEEGDSMITYHKYPYDYDLTTIATPNDLSNGIAIANYWNVINQPIESYVLKTDAGGGNGRVTDAQVIGYKSSVPFMETVYRLNNADGLTDFAPSAVSSGGVTKDSRYLPALHFYRYDGQGNVTEEGKDGETKEVLVWGYNRRFIVARVSSSDYASVIALVDTTVLNNPSSDAAMRTELNKIRTGLASTNGKAKVTTYTYATLKGVTSMTDQSGKITFYEYDDPGRLKRRKNASDQVIENIWYHYKP